MPVSANAGGHARASTVTRVAAAGALIGALLLVVLVLFTGNSGYSVRLDFQDAGGLVTGNQVLIGPATVGSVQSISLTSNGLAQVQIGLDSNASPLPEGTVAHIYENSLSGIANRYIVLDLPQSGGNTIPDNGLIPLSDTYSFVSLDQVFDTFNPLTRLGLQNFIKGEAASIQGKALEANQTLQYLAPALSSTSALTQELVREEPAFDSLLVEGAQSLQQLASRSQELTQLVANANATTGALASQSQALEQTLTLLPGTLTKTTNTFAGLRQTLSVLTPLVNASKPAVRQLPQFLSALRVASTASMPTLTDLLSLIRNPSGGGDLISLLEETPSVARIAATTFPELVKMMNQSQAQLDYLREYTPDVVAALTNLGQAGGYYDANGHYVRTQPVFNAFGLNGSNELTSRSPALRNQGIQVVHGRCPGGAVQPSPDGSAPWKVPGCNPATTPPGP
jgi:phospholipid/cholesterol/gamma-HCH transport system substrate-binding protein